MRISGPSVPLRWVERAVLVGTTDQARHGYAIFQEERARSPGRPGFGVQAVYRALERLGEAGLVREVDPPPEATDPRRAYWRATSNGRRLLRRDLARLEEIVAAGRERVGHV
ncbi:MAG: PadR family transcriptional regulator [Gemmatimonadota bacterium]|jgi:DNA-binding PadR family transcriptional regulator